MPWLTNVEARGREAAPDRIAPRGRDVVLVADGSVRRGVVGERGRLPGDDAELAVGPPIVIGLRGGGEGGVHGGTGDA